MKAVHKILSPLQIIAAAFVFLLAGCATTTKQTEQLLSTAGFHQVAASSDKQLQQLKALKPDKLTTAKLSGKIYYVFPDLAHNQIYVGNLEQYQTYQQLLTYNNIEGQNRVDGVEDQASDDDAGKWVEWTSNSGWTHGSY